MIVLGIDPDKGWALTEHGKKARRIIAVGSVKGLNEMFAKLRELASAPNQKIDLVRIERPKNKHSYDRPGQTRAANKAIAVNVGENFGKSDAIYYFCLGLGLNAYQTPPVKKGTKLSARQIERLTGWTGRTNEHVRDAIVLSWV